MGPGIEDVFNYSLIMQRAVLGAGFTEADCEMDCEVSDGYGRKETRWGSARSGEAASPQILYQFSWCSVEDVSFWVQVE